MVARTGSKLDAAVLEINEASKTKKCIGVVGDVTSSSSIESALQAAERAQKLPADAVVCNAGSAQPKLFLETEGDTFKRQMDLNYMGVVRTVRAALPGLLERDSGALVLVSSGLALTGYAGYAAYAPTKWAVRGLAEVLRSELAATRVSIHLALPPGMATPGFDKENAEKPRVTRAIEAGVLVDVYVRPVETLASSFVGPTRFHALFHLRYAWGSQWSAKGLKEALD